MRKLLPVILTIIVLALHSATFLALHGMEWGVIIGGGHVIVYGIDSLIRWEAGENQIFVPKNTYTGTAGLFSIINRFGPNAIATLAHPKTRDYNNISALYDPAADSAIVGSALASGSAFSTNLSYNPGKWNSTKGNCYQYFRNIDFYS